MIATTIEQSKHLLELGLDPKTADMSYSEEYFGKDNDGNDEWCWRLNACKFIDVEGIIPAWSLSALLEVMCYCHDVDVEFRKDKYLGWICKWTFYDFDNKKRLDLSKCGETKIEAAFEIIVTLFVQGRIKKGGES